MVPSSDSDEADHSGPMLDNIGTHGLSFYTNFHNQCILQQHWKLDNNVKYELNFSANCI